MQPGMVNSVLPETDSEQVPREKDEKNFEKGVKKYVKPFEGKRMVYYTYSVVVWVHSIKEHRSHVDSFHNDLSIFTWKPQKKRMC